MHDATLDHQTGDKMDSQYRTITYIPARSTAHAQDRQSAQTRRTVDICCMTKKK